MFTEGVGQTAAEDHLVLAGGSKPAGGHDVDAQSSQEGRLQCGEEVGVGPQLFLLHRCWCLESVIAQICETAAIKF